MVDPVQQGLIAPHVTLCREDELEGRPVEEVLARAAVAPATDLVLRFGPPERFHEHGILLPCAAGADAFHALRVHLLGDPSARRQQAHITLAHPRNPRASGNDLGATAPLGGGLTIRFTRVSLIEQVGHGPWHILADAPLGAGRGSLPDGRR